MLPAAAAPVVRFPALRLAGGGTAAAHQSSSGDPSDAAAARRRAEILRSPYARFTERRVLRGGEVVVASDPELPAALRDALLRDLAPALSALFERDGWAKPFSSRAPLVLEVSSGPAASAAGWDGRERDGGLRSPIAIVSAAGRDAAAVLLDALHQIALLSVRQAAPDEPSWAVEGVAEYLARRAAGAAGPPVPEDDVLLESAGALTSPPVLAAFLEAIESRLPKGAADVREAWETAGAGGDAQAFLRDVAARSGVRGPSGRARGGRRRAPRVRGRALRSPRRPRSRGARGSSGSASSAGPAPLGWRRVSLRTEDERGGVELALPDTGFRAGRAVLFYRGDAGEFDSVPGPPGETRLLPAAGTVGSPRRARGRRRLGRRAASAPRARVPGGARGVRGRVAGGRRRGRVVDGRSTATCSRGSSSAARSAPDGEGEAAVAAVPAATDSPDATSYLYVDRDARPAARYRYRVLALTRDGLLSEAFEARVETR